MPCNDPSTGELIGSYELGLLSDDEKRRFEEHVVECDACFEDLYRTAPVIAKMKPAAAARRRRAWPVWLGAAAALVLMVYVGRMLGPSQPQERLRGTERTPVVVFAPIGEVPRPTELDWKVVPSAGSYEVAIVTSDGETVWRGTTEVPPMELPASVREGLEPGRPYFWQVKAQGEQDWVSPETKFTIRD